MNYEKVSDFFGNHTSGYEKALKATLFNLPFYEWFDAASYIISKASHLFFIGNGASSSMASHFATDWTKNAGIPSESLNDGAMMTCFSNDYSYEDAYVEMLKRKFKNNDVLICISSSGNSNNIIKAAAFAKEKDIGSVISFTGFLENNILRQSSRLGCYVPSNQYGIVESAHAYYLHLLLDYYMDFYKK